MHPGVHLQAASTNADTTYTFVPATTATVMSGFLPPVWLPAGDYRSLINGQLLSPAEQPTTGLVNGLGSTYLAAVNVAGGVTRLLAAPVSNPDGYLLLSGAVARNSSVGRLGVPIRLASTTDTNDVLTSTDGARCLELAGAGRVLDRRCFDVSFTDSASGDQLGSAGFTALLALPAGTTRVTLTMNGTSLDSVAQTASPQVAITSHTGPTWDGPRRSRGQSVARTPTPRRSPVSANGGATWLPWAPDLQAQQLTVDPAALQTGNMDVFRSLVSDGLSTASIDVGPFTIPLGTGKNLGLGGECELSVIAIRAQRHRLPRSALGQLDWLIRRLQPSALSCSS